MSNCLPVSLGARALVTFCNHPEEEPLPDRGRLNPIGVAPAEVRGMDLAFSPFNVPSMGNRFSGGSTFFLNDNEGIFQCFRGDVDSFDSNGISSSVFSALRGMPFNSAGDVTSTVSSEGSAVV